MKNKYEYFLFDLDGTLTDSSEGIINCAVYALTELGRKAPEREALRPFLGPPLSWSFRNLCGLEEDEAEEAVRIYRRRYSTIGLFENRSYDGIPELLGALKKDGLRLAVATSKPEVFSVRILEKFGLMEYFDAVVGCGLDGSLDTKAEVVAEALRRLGVQDKSRAVMVGDRKYDVAGAAEAGLRTIGAGWGYAEAGELEEAGALWIAKEPEELLRTLMTE